MVPGPSGSTLTRPPWARTRSRTTASGSAGDARVGAQLELERIRLVAQADADGAAPGGGEGVLHEPVGGELDAADERAARPLDVQGDRAAVRAGGVDEPVQPVERRQRRALGPRVRPQAAEQVAHRVERRPPLLLEPREAGDRVAGARGDAGRARVGQRDHRLDAPAGGAVELRGEPDPLDLDGQPGRLPAAAHELPRALGELGGEPVARGHEQPGRPDAGAQGQDEEQRLRAGDRVGAAHRDHAGEHERQPCAAARRSSRTPTS